MTTPASHHGVPDRVARFDACAADDAIDDGVERLRRRLRSARRHVIDHIVVVEELTRRGRLRRFADRSRKLEDSGLSTEDGARLERSLHVLDRGALCDVGR
jgi:hypothetical protein